MSSRTAVTAVAGVLLVPLLTAAGTGAFASAATSPPLSTLAAACPNVMEESSFASAQELRDLNAKVAGFGLRSSASSSEQHLIDWLERSMLALPGVTTRADPFTIDRWQPLPQATHGPGRDLAKAGSLVAIDTAGEAVVPVAGAVPYSLPTGRDGQQGDLVYLPPGEAITAANAAGKVVIRDVPKAPLPFAGFLAFSYYMTLDLLGDLATTYERPGLATDGPLSEELLAAGRAGAAGAVFVFDVPRAQVEGYFDPHKGIHYDIPAVFAGVDEGERLKRLAEQGGEARVAVLAEVDEAPTRNLIATLPGKSAERIVFESNVDGNTWVQANGIAGMIALARYFARLPLECRPRTLEFAFASGHLHIARDGTKRYAAQLDEEYDDGSVAFAFVLEHLGTREILPVARVGAPGSELRFTGKGEVSGWFSGESPALFNAAVQATLRRKLDRTAVLRGIDVPTATHLPLHCNFGGLGTVFHGKLIPTLAMMSGPWSLWAPSFGESAIDFARMRKQLLAAGDATLALDQVPREVIAGPYLAYRAARSLGAPTCTH